MKHLHPMLTTSLVLFLSADFIALADSPPGQLTRTSVTLPSHGTLVFQVPAGWTHEIRQAPEDMPPTITFQPRGEARFKILVTPFWNTKEVSGFNSEDKLRSKVEEIRARALHNSVEQDIVIQKVQGEHVLAMYISATDRASKPDEYRFMTAGVAALDDLMILFTILTNDKDGTIAASALEMLKTAVKEIGHPAYGESLLLLVDIYSMIHGGPLSPSSMQDAELRQGYERLRLEVSQVFHSSEGAEWLSDVIKDAKSQRYILPILEVLFESQQSVALGVFPAFLEHPDRIVRNRAKYYIKRASKWKVEGSG